METDPSRPEFWLLHAGHNGGNPRIPIPAATVRAWIMAMPVSDEKLAYLRWLNDRTTG